jgi:hypothetical protein
MMETVTEEGSDDGYITAEDEIPKPRGSHAVQDQTTSTIYESFASPKS